MGQVENARMGEMVHAPRAGTPAAKPLPESFEPANFLLGRRGAGRPVRGVAGGKVKVGQTIAFRGLSCFAKLRHLHHAAPKPTRGYTEGAATLAWTTPTNQTASKASNGYCSRLPPRSNAARNATKPRPRPSNSSRATCNKMPRTSGKTPKISEPSRATPKSCTTQSWASKPSPKPTSNESTASKASNPVATSYDSPPASSHAGCAAAGCAAAFRPRSKTHR